MIMQVVYVFLIFYLFISIDEIKKKYFRRWWSFILDFIETLKYFYNLSKPILRISKLPLFKKIMYYDKEVFLNLAIFTQIKHGLSLQVFLAYYFSRKSCAMIRNLRNKPHVATKQ